ncbi:HTH domain-containing protein [Streptomyces acidiscabies]|uniref:HTH domain-containing protein n=1 Tax=Streptomyces acidiscabies TaxID=42234 RepID=A0ABU4M9A8_9ACTN|nr:HTH domain-containing protein [Streptomyces acidiscabies]MDX3024045.1 HTH domain-containing protein [Streptomyces acidiscabies]
MTRADRRTLVRQLNAEGLSARRIAERLKVGKDTVRRDLEAIASEDAQQAAPPGAPDVPDAPQVGGDVADGAAPQDAPPAGPGAAGAPDGDAPDAPVARLPRRVAQPLDGIDLSGWPAVRRDLAVLAQTGRSPEAMAHQAIVALAHHYGRALATGRLEPGVPFIVHDMTLTPLPVPAGREAPPPEAA